MRGAAQGIIFQRSVKDANNNIHSVSMSFLLGLESGVTARAHCTAERLFLGGADGPLNHPWAVTIVDGGIVCRPAPQPHFTHVSACTS